MRVTQAHADGRVADLTRLPRGPTLVTQRPPSTAHFRSPATAVPHPSSAARSRLGCSGRSIQTRCMRSLLAPRRWWCTRGRSRLGSSPFSTRRCSSSSGASSASRTTRDTRCTCCSRTRSRTASISGRCLIASTLLLGSRCGDRFAGVPHRPSAGVPDGAVSIAAALGLAFGRVFWSQAVIAEVYTLHAAIVAGVVLSLLAWRQTRRERFVLRRDCRVRRRAGQSHDDRGACAGHRRVCVDDRSPASPPGCARSRRRPPFSRPASSSTHSFSSGHISPASTSSRGPRPPGELLDVMLGRQFSDRLFAFEWQTVMRDRLPSLVEHVLAPGADDPRPGAGCRWRRVAPSAPARRGPALAPHRGDHRGFRRRTTGLSTRLCSSSLASSCSGSPPPLAPSARRDSRDGCAGEASRAAWPR